MDNFRHNLSAIEQEQAVDARVVLVVLVVVLFLTRATTGVLYKCC